MRAVLSYYAPRALIVVPGRSSPAADREEVPFTLGAAAQSEALFGNRSSSSRCALMPAFTMPYRCSSPPRRVPFAWLSQENAGIHADRARLATLLIAARHFRPLSRRFISSDATTPFTRRRRGGALMPPASGTFSSSRLLSPRYSRQTMHFLSRLISRYYLIL